MPLELLSLPAAADFAAAANPGSTAQIVEVRTWELYRAYPSIAQGNVV